MKTFNENAWQLSWWDSIIIWMLERPIIFINLTMIACWFRLGGKEKEKE